MHLRVNLIDAQSLFAQSFVQAITEKSYRQTNTHIEIKKERTKKNERCRFFTRFISI